MTDCQLMLTCPYFNGEFQGAPELTEELKEKYCRDEYAWCGRYQLYNALGREPARAVLSTFGSG